MITTFEFILKKCKIVVKELTFLGQTISKLGIRPEVDKLEAIWNAPSIKNLNELQAYLDLLNYYSQFIPNLSMELTGLFEFLKRV